MFGNLKITILAAVVTLFGSGQAWAFDYNTEPRIYHRVFVGSCEVIMSGRWRVTTTETLPSSGPFYRVAMYQAGRKNESVASGKWVHRWGASLDPVVLTHGNPLTAEYVASCLNVPASEILNFSATPPTEPVSDVGYYGFSYEHNGGRCEFAFSGTDNTIAVVSTQPECTTAAPANQA